jgi:tetratricopeptide (TPR) repeat protein
LINHEYLVPKTRVLRMRIQGTWQGEIMKKIIAALSVAILIIAGSAFAANKTFIKEYTYLASDLDSKVSSRAIALEQVKRALLEELGTYLISKTEVRDFQLTRDQITTLTAGVVSAEIIDEKWDGRSYYLKARISADPDQVAKSVDSLRNDVKKTRELEDARKKADDAMREVERLKKELAVAKADTNRQGEYIHAVNKLSANEWLSKARKFYEANAYQDAIDAFSKAIALDPKNVYAYHGRGIAYVLSAKDQQAINDFTKLIELDPKDAGGYRLRGDAYQELGKYEQVVADYTKVIELEPKNPTPVGVRGLAYFNLGKYQKAIDDYTKLIEMNPKDWTSYDFRGYTYKKFGKYQEAIDDYTKVIELHPEDKRMYVTRGNVYEAAGMFSQAIDDYTRAIEANPKDKSTCVSAYIMRGSLFKEHFHDYKRAIDDYTRVIEMHPKDKYWLATSYAERGATYNKLGDHEHAIADFTRQIELYPKGADGYENRGLVYEKWGKTEQATADFKMAARLGDTMARKVLKERGIAW